ncbi:hypothetical protein MUP59_10485 [Candidatus Bathyarchaeota archaeon]|nr:hypothetical protein [Candidatus Bathyarchaeota archaeon]
MAEEDLVQVQGVVVELSEGSAIKFVSHRGYDKLLCEHVYMRFCPNCPQTECGRRRV